MTISSLKISNMQSNNGNDVPNQFIIEYRDETRLQNHHR